MKKLFFLLINSIIASSVFAEVTQKELQVEANIQKTCTISANDINFGYWNFTEGNIGVKSTIDVLCNKDLPYTIGGSEHGSSWPYQGGTGTWVYVIKMKGSQPDNDNWLAYRIHIGHDVVATNYSSQSGNVLGMGNIVNTSKNMKTAIISSIGTGNKQSHPITGILYGNDTETSKRFIAVKPDTYIDNYSLTITY